jgi:hypothetical protein
MSESENYERNTKEQYERLGRFVEMFEAVVQEARDACIDLLGRDRQQKRLIEIAFHHQVLTAKPIFEIMRAIIIEIVDSAIKDGVALYHGPEKRAASKSDREAFLGLMKFIADEYDDLVKMRNALLHATWFVGYKSEDDPASSEFFARKFVVTKEGLSSVELPKNARQLEELSHRCDLIRTWIGFLVNCAKGSYRLEDHFEQDGKRWFLKFATGYRTTLPATLPSTAEEQNASETTQNSTPLGNSSK